MAEPPLTGPSGQYWGDPFRNHGESRRNDGPSIVYRFENAMTMFWDKTQPFHQSVYCNQGGYQFLRRPRLLTATEATSETRPGAARPG